MRFSYSDQLIKLDQQRRAAAHGSNARRFHLKVVAFASLLLCTLIRLAAWLHPKKATHVWIDNVLVEVFEDSKLDKVCGLLEGLFVASFVVLLLLSLFRSKSDHTNSQDLKRRNNLHSVPEEDHRNKGVPETFHSIAVSPGVLRGPSFSELATTNVSALRKQNRGQQQCEPSIRSQPELENFLLAREPAKRVEIVTHHRPSCGAVGTTQTSTATSGVPYNTNGALRAPLAGGAISSGPSDGIRVQYQGRGDQLPAGDGVEKMLDAAWAELGVRNPKRSIAKIRHWLSYRCQLLSEEVSASDRWFAERQISFFD
ncbi:hypothetical protein, conserved in T.vivax, (fragment), partial [Trypanosoma vivax Y486]